MEGEVMKPVELGSSFNIDDLRVSCGSFKLCEKMVRDENLSECCQCVNLNCSIGIHNYLEVCDLVAVKDKEGGGF